MRYGGDEFIIIRHEVSKAGDKGMIDRIRQSLEAWNDEYGSDDYKLSFSCGSAVYNQAGDIESVIKEADSEMYKNKEYNRRREDQRP